MNEAFQGINTLAQVEAVAESSGALPSLEKFFVGCVPTGGGIKKTGKVLTGVFDYQIAGLDAQVQAVQQVPLVSGWAETLGVTSRCGVHLVTGG